MELNPHRPVQDLTTALLIRAGGPARAEAEGGGGALVLSLTAGGEGSRVGEDHQEEEQERGTAEEEEETGEVTGDRLSLSSRAEEEGTATVAASLVSCLLPSRLYPSPTTTRRPATKPSLRLVFV